MATKTLSITEHAYERLAGLRKGNESFSEIIERITNKVNILDFAGILKKSEAAEVESRIKETRSKSKKRMEEIRKELAQ